MFSALKAQVQFAQAYELNQFLGFGFCLQKLVALNFCSAERKVLNLKHNKQFKRDSAHVAFLVCV